MIVPMIDKNGVFPVEGKGYTPVAAHLHCPMALEVAGRLVQSPPRHVHIRGRLRKIEQLKPVCKLLRVCRQNARFASGPEESLNARMTEAPDHMVSVAHHASGGDLAPAPAFVPVSSECAAKNQTLGAKARKAHVLAS